MKQNQFERFNLKSYILDAVRTLGFDKPTEIQERVLPSLLKGSSLIGQSQTGTGKTHSYLLPIMNKLDAGKNEVQAIISAPTRELANQIYKEALKIADHFPEDEQIQVRCFIGGTDKQRMIDKLKIQPQLVIGTPGRIKDLVEAQALQVYTAKMLVVDEADLMLDMGFLEDVDLFASRMAEKIQMLVFSATIPEKLKPFLNKYMENPKYVQVNPKQATAAKIEHVLIPLRHRNREQLLHDIIVRYNPYLAIVFTNTKKMADHVANSLIEKGLNVGRIHGDLTPRERKKMMKQIKDLEYQFIVATDLASRGIDIEGVSHIINYELPSDLDFYIHRTGRTARAGYSGIAATIYDTSDEDSLNRLEKMGIEFHDADIQNGDWINIDERNKRKNRKKQKSDIDVKASRHVKKPTKVKPGYKKKIQRDVENFKKRERRIQRKK
ncbi:MULTISPECIES: DEAD/DEAH box helicase [unclassified Peribacillus]|uniref:DEAD/DEAH box helicase n=1 Tax=unclassified Peribacillus TaxID=2675266 RepID=UPI00191130C8|nr:MULTISPECIES: DEAD/DEAH box helicase [unclassified Peribacillus]MBK5442577.1 DEAD/DEAH box helicase [Peribacillus sp. TH24]MBK5462677.1 DEAD/DEAH box helicase [Peribacillus sp. TH27]MBK5483985.1 DEAD/DEAH box helicase [Peribacillus sp. TH16]MBK5500830.1 DEAD/DEAH box helicase [Peribacillus sp. TH14]WMX54158.1 DEAD/DEAH box helicase [Peribacillus sp. R9-11]